MTSVVSPGTSTTTGPELTQAFLTPAMHAYFERKLPDIDRAEVATRIEEALKFLNMATYCHGNIPVSQEIDDIWHLWILETKEYENLCGKLQGRRFIHHSSNEYAECHGEALQEQDGGLEHHVAMLANYVLNYGPFEADRLKYWPFAANLVKDCGCTVAQLNDWLTSAGDAKL